MNPFECCHKCIAPKRHPGCGSTCVEYQEASAKWNEQKERARQERDRIAAVRSVLIKRSRRKFKD